MKENFIYLYVVLLFIFTAAITIYQIKPVLRRINKGNGRYIIIIACNNIEIQEFGEYIVIYDSNWLKL